ncbi:LOW QUALITY PROTEIN: hypothetical protein NC652_039756 [Populus alba x Populus x berolinensis]|nr:LOW QUALITY PROTEIN: hypothetical protein NC652_039756 [Populus alba x Populus x berolinensis]
MNELVELFEIALWCLSVMDFFSDDGGFGHLYIPVSHSEEEANVWLTTIPVVHKQLLFCSVILFPIAITFYITWWFIHFVDGFFSPIYAQLGIDIFGLGFITSLTFIFIVGVFMSSWLGASVLSLGEWFIKRMPFVRHIYNASKQISAAISPDQNTQAFKEVAIIRHPRIGEYAFGFITSTVTLQNYSGEEELCCVYVPTNHLYIGDIFLVTTKDVIRPNLSVREGIEIVVSGGMSMPQVLSTLDSSISVDRNLKEAEVEESSCRWLVYYFYWFQNESSERPLNQLCADSAGFEHASVNVLREVVFKP